MASDVLVLFAQVSRSKDRQMISVEDQWIGLVVLGMDDESPSSYSELN
jgi:hypothetical protein